MLICWFSKHEGSKPLNPNLGQGHAECLPSLSRKWPRIPLKLSSLFTGFLRGQSLQAVRSAGQPSHTCSAAHWFLIQVQRGNFGPSHHKQVPTLPSRLVRSVCHSCYHSC